MSNSSLTNVLKNAGYDFIDSPIRNQKPLQLWVKKSFNEVDLYYDHVSLAVKSDTALEVVEGSALSVNHSNTQKLDFNIGITVLDELLTALGMGNLGISTKLQTGKQVTISYSSSKTATVSTGPIENYLSTGDFLHPNRAFLRNANKDNIIIITGILYAKDVKAIIETSHDISAEIEAEFGELAEGNISFTKTGNKKLEMKSEGNAYFPIAVKANRIDWDRGQFKNIKLVSDNRNFF